MSAYRSSDLQSDATRVLGASRQRGLAQQFGHPTGVLGVAVGHLMATKNARMNRFAVEMLDIQPEDQVLEIGFGSGTVIQMLATQANLGFVAGIDPSAVMVKQATGRNRRLMQAGRVELRRAVASNLPYEDRRFTKVCAVNSFHHWSSQEEDLKEVSRVMRHGGLLLLCLRLEHPSREFMVAPGFTEEEIEGVRELLRRTGFRDLRTERRRLGREIVCVMGIR